MGRSTPSCFKVITCATDSVDIDDLQAIETKGSSDKRGWSFRKRSPKHRVLNNTAISDVLPSGNNKESQESIAVNYQVEANSAIPEKPSEMQWKDETPQSTTSVNSKSSEIIDATEDAKKFDKDHNESVIIVIQAAIRGFLAQRSLLKHKNVVKLQAAVRGHLVRSHAVGTLRCVQAIVKMQALVRARRARLSAEGLRIKEKLDEKHQEDNYSSKLQGKQNSGTKPDLTNTSIEKLLSNSFARQLMESTTKTKPIKIKCDPSKSDSAWKWLERWVSVSPTGVEQSLKPELSAKLDEPEKDKCPENQLDNEIPSTDYCDSRDLFSTTEEATMPSLDSSMGEAAVPSESEVNSLTQKSESFSIQPHSEITAMSNPRENSDFPPNEDSQSDLIPQVEFNSLSAKPELEMEQPNRSMKRNAPEQIETEERKLLFGSRKACNPAFIAAQSKFEELTSTMNPAKSVNSSNQDLGIESCAADVSSATDNAIKTKEIDLAENSVPYNSRIQLIGCERGTELSVSSTLDSPVRSEPLPVEYKQQSDVLEEETSDPKSNKKVDIEAKVDPTIPNIDLSCPISDQPEKFDNGNAADGEPFNSILVGDSSHVDQKLEENASAQTEMGPETVHQVCKSSTPEAFPRSHMTTLPESQGTPSSQVSSKAKKNTGSHKNGSRQKLKSLSAGERSPIKPNHDSGARCSLEKLPKEQHKTGKQQSSSEHLEVEPRDSSGSNSLPSYMQATESAKAKAQVCSSSPRSSLDVTEKDIYVKKRHSLPGVNGRHGSPRIQRSMSQAQQGTKGSSIHTSQERKWQR
ncbi:hypothetical protein LguiA_006825 [Lonicera macranthoides]